jgi:hypothetical protein
MLVGAHDHTSSTPVLGCEDVLAKDIPESGYPLAMLGDLAELYMLHYHLLQFIGIFFATPQASPSEYLLHTQGYQHSIA